MLWLQTNVPGPSPFVQLAPTPAATQQIPWEFRPYHPLRTVSFPKVMIQLEDIGFMQPKADDINDTLAVDPATGATQKGRWSTSIVGLEFFSANRMDQYNTGDYRVSLVRDIVLNALKLAGRKDDSGAYILPSIQINDLVTAPRVPVPTNNALTIDWGAAWDTERPIVDKGNPEIIVWKSVLRVKWPGLWSV
jgi:hypothetical protein